MLRGVTAPRSFCGFLTFSRYSGRKPTSSPYRTSLSLPTLRQPSHLTEEVRRLCAPASQRVCPFGIEPISLIASTLKTGTSTAHQPGGIFLERVPQAQSELLRTPPTFICAVEVHIPRFRSFLISVGVRLASNFVETSLMGWRRRHKVL